MKEIEGERGVWEMWILLRRRVKFESEVKSFNLWKTLSFALYHRESGKHVFSNISNIFKIFTIYSKCKLLCLRHQIMKTIDIWMSNTDDLLRGPAI